MNPNESLVTALNKMREMSVSEGSIYHQYVPVVTQSTSIADFGNAILNVPVVMNEFVNKLVNRIVYTSFTTKYFNNPLQILEGERIPLGYAGEEMYINPSKARQYNVNDFAGLLQKYEMDVKVQYTQVNMDLQYPVTITRHKLKQAFTSWDELERFISDVSNSLYNGAYIDEFQFSKALVSSAYAANSVQYETVSAVNSEANAKAFITKLREIFLGMALPSTRYNAWEKVGGYGRPVKIWSSKEDIVLLLRNDILAYTDVNVLAAAFNMEKADFLGRVIAIDNFDVYDDNGTKTFDGSNILGFIGDSSWFRIKRQDMYLDEFYNANNRTWQYYLNLTKMYNYSLFANGVVLCTSAPTLNPSSMKFTDATGLEVEEGKTLELHIETTPFPANATITYSSGTQAKATVAAKSGNNKIAVVTGVADGTSVITATCGSVTATYTVTVVDPAA